MSGKVMFLMRAFVLVVWAAFFTWLLVSGEVHRYIGSRTYWVVVFGAVMLTLAAVVHLRVEAGAAAERKPKVTDALGLLAVLLPILVVVLVPKPGLGALAASKKGSGGIVSATIGLQPPAVGSPGGELSLEEIEYAGQSSEYAAAVGIVEGVSVKLVGFVTHPKNAPEGGFALTRFAIFCCAADAVPYSARVVPPSTATGFQDDQWLEITGTLAKDDDGFYVEADDIKTIDEPNDPYLK